MHYDTRLLITSTGMLAGSRSVCGKLVVQGMEDPRVCIRHMVLQALDVALRQLLPYASDKGDVLFMAACQLSMADGAEHVHPVTYHLCLVFLLCEEMHEGCAGCGRSWC